MWSRSSWPGSRRPPGAEGGPRARGERSDLERLPPPPIAPGHSSRTLPDPEARAGRSAAPHPHGLLGARGDAPTGPGSRLRGSHFSHRTHPLPALTGRSRAAIWPSLAVSLAASAAARGLPRVRSRPGLEARRRGAGHNPPPPPPPSRLPCPSAGLLPAATGERRPAALREPREPPPPEPRGGNSNGHGHWRDGPAETAARGGGACTLLGGGRCCPGPGPAPGPAPPPAPRAPPPEAARAPPLSPLGQAARVRRSAPGGHWEQKSGGARGRSAEGGASAESPV